MKNSIVTTFEKRVFKNLKKHPPFSAGDTVNVHYKIVDKTDAAKSRIQQFEGVVLRYRKGTTEATFTVRKISAGGIGVERAFPLYSPNVEKIEVKSKGVVRRARLYYLRELSGKSARIRSRFFESGGLTTEASPVEVPEVATDPAAAPEA
jgi:large subunit ribosomal protein L19